MKIEYCCLKRNVMGLCHHNVKINGKKKHLIDIGCKYDKDEVIKIIESNTIVLEDGWLYDCYDENYS
ncbi:hypothetical protein J4771_00875 [Candidatus Kaistella beijingensis]|uniref:hypothetical protein n=1 Tax=Candidatus Kaistella beijingensis TaxID=2820270 RepID=UPI001CC4B6EC|nr:hypothetical protein [Candidatus Kaistella beijingensis]UBB89936.1 hypothetical protein J4771_00875 [Candidatus Kaistella beijingensis]